MGRKAKKRKTAGEGQGPSEEDRMKAEEARRIADRAIKRLNILEYLILLAAVVLALLGGALVAWVLAESVELPFRVTWAIASLLLFIIPGGSVYLRELRRGKR